MARLSLNLLLLLVTALATTAQAQVAEGDSLALVALYNTTGGPNWTDNTNWLTAPVSHWSGVTVTGDRVASLGLSNNGLTGSIPSELGDLANLTLLGLSNNGLTGSIPSELGDLANLIGLDLSFNQLTGAIPPELGTLTNLTFLFFNNNQLTGSIPPELGSLANLTFLFLDENQLTGSIPSELGSLTNLTILILADNPLSGTLPLSLIDLSVLNIFWFDNTDLCEPIDPAFQAWLQGINNLRSTGCTNVATEEAAEIPADFALLGNYPNPFNPTTLIRYALPQPVPVRLSVYDVQGRLVTVLVETEQATGWHEVTFESGALPSGVYLYRLTAGSISQTKLMTLLK